jgi:hypothetical protein
MAITINGNGTVTGISVGGLPDGIVDTDMLAANAVTPAKATGSTKGVTEVDLWWISSSVTLSNGDYFTSNWERGDSQFEKIGTGMTQSSGVFTFPSAGKWLLLYQFTGYDVSNNDASYVGVMAYTSTDAATSWSQSQSFYTNATGIDAAHWTLNAHMIYDVTDASNFRIKWKYDATGSQRVFGNTNYPYSGITFIKLGDT